MDEREKAKNMTTIAMRLVDHIGKEVVVEGCFPLPVAGEGNKMQIVAAPTSRGKLVAVYSDGFELLDDDDVAMGHEPAIYPLLNVRSVQPYKRDNIVPVRSKLIT